MKRLLLALLFITFASVHAAPSIAIGDMKLFQAYAPPESKIGLREYVPAGESVENWTRMASVRVFKDQKDPKEYLMAVSISHQPR